MIEQLFATPFHVCKGVELAGVARMAAALVAAWPPDEGVCGPVCFGLCGTLGAGKTLFSQELAVALGIQRASVTSPTFTLMRSYPCGADPDSPQSLHHLDVYRLDDEDAFWELGVEEILDDASAWTIIEWADRFADAMPEHTIWIHIDVDPLCPETRIYKFACQDSQRQGWVTQAVTSQ